MVFTPAQLITGPEPLGTRYGLFSVAAGPLDLPTNARSGGITYDPVSCGTARRYPIDCPAGITPPAKTFDPGDADVTAEPFIAYATLLCAPVGYTTEQLADRVRRRLAAGEQSAVEQQLAIDLAAAAATVVATDSTSLESVVSALEQWLYGSAAGEQGYGHIGFLHLPFAAGAYSDGVVDRDGAIYRTRIGTRAVFGDYPAGTVYITGHTTVWRSPDVLVPPLPQVLDRTTNQLYAIAEREYAVAWECAAGAATWDVGASS